MRLTSKGRYAVTAMLDVALNSETGPVPLADISERQGISLSYLEQLFSSCVKMDWFPAFVAQAAVICWVKMRAVLLLAK
jgi:Rrf2 family iron-sulfur cluster assembly transcriptional regulator